MKLRTRLATPLAARPRPGYVIFAVLIVIVVLALVGYRFADAMGTEYRAAVRTQEEAQVKMAAYSGLHYAAAVLADRNTFNNELGGNPFDNPDIFEQFEVQPSGATPPDRRRAFFSIRAAGLDPSSVPAAYKQTFGVVDEGGKLNINALIALDPTGQTLASALTQIPLLSNRPDIVDSIVDWVDADEDARTNGAESSYYQSLSNPYMAKNGPLNSLDELLLVKGMDYTLLYGGDTNRNGIQDGNETDNTPGLASFITVYGRELNVDSTGTARIYLNGDDLNTLYQQLQTAVGNPLAAYIVASKLFNATPVTQTVTVTSVSGGSGGSGKSGGSGGSGGSMTITIGGGNSKSTPATTDQLVAAVETALANASSSGQRIRSVMSLIGTQITLPNPPNTPPNTPPLVATSPLNDPAQLPQLLPLLMDHTTVRQAIEMVPRINVNTAPYEVLLSIVDQNGNPLLTDTTAQAIITQRANNVPTDPATLCLAWLITTNTITSAQYQQLEKYITGTSMVYRVQSIGYFNGGGPTARMEAVIDTNQGAPRFLLIRDLADLENPPGFPTNQPQQ
jgi:type II secretory pathway component PulK